MIYFYLFILFDVFFPVAGQGGVIFKPKGVPPLPGLVRIPLNLTTAFPWTCSFLSRIFMEVDVSSDKEGTVRIPDMFPKITTFFFSPPPKKPLGAL